MLLSIVFNWRLPYLCSIIHEKIKTMKLSSNLVGKTSEQIKSIAQNIASETFIKNGNKAVSFTENVELRCLVGGRYQSYPELSKFVIAAYNEMTATLIIANL